MVIASAPLSTRPQGYWRRRPRTQEGVLFDCAAPIASRTRFGVLHRELALAVLTVDRLLSVSAALVAWSRLASTGQCGTLRRYRCVDWGAFNLYKSLSGFVALHVVGTWAGSLQGSLNSTLLL